MRNVVLALATLVTSAAAAPAQNTDWVKKMFQAEGGTLVHDFGSVPRGALLVHKFKMKNIWAVPIEIVEVRSLCGCVTAAASKNLLQPRETGVLEVAMDARRFTGPKSVSIHITVGPEYVSTATLQVSANSRADIVFNPGEINFGIVPAGQNPSQTIDVEYAGNLDWRVAEVIQGNAPLDVAIEELYRRPGQVGYHLRVTLKADAQAGAHKWELLLKTNDPVSPHVPVLVEATVQASLTVVPAAVSMGTLSVGETVLRRVVVRGNKPFKIVAVEGLGDGVQVELPTTAAAVHALTIKCQPTQTGELRRQLIIKTDLGAEAPVTVTVVGAVGP